MKNYCCYYVDGTETITISNKLEDKYLALGMLSLQDHEVELFKKELPNENKHHTQMFLSDFINLFTSSKYSVGAPGADAVVLSWQTLFGGDDYEDLQ